jgi:hypothetical protein
MKHKYVVSKRIKYQISVFLLRDYKYFCFLFHKYLITFISVIEKMIMR